MFTSFPLLAVSRTPRTMPVEVSMNRSPFRARLKGTVERVEPVPPGCLAKSAPGGAMATTTSNRDVHTFFIVLVLYLMLVAFWLKVTRGYEGKLAVSRKSVYFGAQEVRRFYICVQSCPFKNGTLRLTWIYRALVNNVCILMNNFRRHKKLPTTGFKIN